jgi:hypothetical protein
MTRLEKIKALIEYELVYMAENGNADDAKDATNYIVSLFNTFTDKGIDKVYKIKFED